MSDNDLLYCLVAFVLGYFLCRMMGNGFSVEGQNQNDIKETLKSFYQLLNREKGAFDCVNIGDVCEDHSESGCPTGLVSIASDIENEGYGDIVCGDLCVDPLWIQYGKKYAPEYPLFQGQCKNLGYTKCLTKSTLAKHGGKYPEGATCRVEAPVVGELQVASWVEDKDKNCGKPRNCSSITKDITGNEFHEICIGSMDPTTKSNCILEDLHGDGDLKCVSGDESCQMSIETCSKNECNNHGTCIGERTTPFKGTCKCKSGWEGDKCQKKVDLVPCGTTGLQCSEKNCWCVPAIDPPGHVGPPPPDICQCINPPSSMV